ncbi:MAG: permease [Brevibacillus sp.]|nr:permease [Brevibacillus sp.]
MIARLRKLMWEMLGALLLGSAIYFLVAGNTLLPADLEVSWSPRWLDVKTLFLSIILEAIPFVLMGVFFSALIQTFVKEETVRKWTPRHPLLAIPFATVLGFLFPVCECAIVPVIRRLIQKGMPIYVGIVFLLAGPIVNPVVLTSTYIAFQRDPDMVVYRAVLAVIVAAVVGVLVWLYVGCRPERALRKGLAAGQANTGLQAHDQHHHGHGHVHAHQHVPADKLSATFQHAVDEFFDMGKYLLFGALVSAVLQVFIARDTLAAIGQSPISANLVMMGLAFLFSLCSEADAFIAASFANTFSFSALLAFLVFGPMIDLKNTLLLLSAFRLRFVAALVGTVSLLVMAGTLLVSG